MRDGRPLGTYQTSNGPAPTAYGVALLRAWNKSDRAWQTWTIASNAVGLDWNEALFELEEAGYVLNAQGCTLAAAGQAVLDAVTK